MVRDNKKVFAEVNDEGTVLQREGGSNMTNCLLSTGRNNTVDALSYGNSIYQTNDYGDIRALAIVSNSLLIINSSGQLSWEGRA